MHQHYGITQQTGSIQGEHTGNEMILTVFQANMLHCKAILGRGQPGVMKRTGVLDQDAGL